MLPDGARYYDKDQCCFRLQRYDACSQMGQDIMTKINVVVSGCSVMMPGLPEMGQDIMTKINVVSGCSVMMPAPRWGKIL